MSARRYLAIVQDARGYPGRGAPLDPAPPDGPEPPMAYQVVKADDYERLETAARKVIEAFDASHPGEIGPVEHAIDDLEAVLEGREPDGA